MADHRCQPPVIAASVPVLVPQQPDWTCGHCGRMWRDCRTPIGTQWWAEVRGPTGQHPGEIGVTWERRRG